MSSRPILKPDTPIWVVIDPRSESVIEDVLFKTTLQGLGIQVLGGLDIESENVTIYAYGEQYWAADDASGRLIRRDELLAT